MFGTNTVGSKITGPIKIADGIQVNAENYCKFFNKTFFE